MVIYIMFQVMIHVFGSRHTGPISDMISSGRIINKAGFGVSVVIALQAYSEVVLAHEMKRISENEE